MSALRDAIGFLLYLWADFQEWRLRMACVRCGGFAGAEEVLCPKCEVWFNRTYGKRK